MVGQLRVCFQEVGHLCGQQLSGRRAKLSSDNQKWGQYRHRKCSLLCGVALTEHIVNLFRAGRRGGEKTMGAGERPVCPHPGSDYHLMLWIDSYSDLGRIFISI